MQGDRQGTTGSSRGDAGQIPERKGANAALSQKIHFLIKSVDQKFSVDALCCGLIPFVSNVAASSLTILKTA